MIPDVYLVPVSYTYEKLLEGGFVNELLGEKKKRESVAKKMAKKEDKEAKGGKKK